MASSLRSRLVSKPGFVAVVAGVVGVGLIAVAESPSTTLPGAAAAAPASDAEKASDKSTPTEKPADKDKKEAGDKEKAGEKAAATHTVKSGKL